MASLKFYSSSPCYEQDSLGQEKDAHIYKIAEKSEDNTSKSQSIHRSQREIKARTSMFHYMSYGVTNGVVLVCVCISLIVSVWSAVEVRRLSNSADGSEYKSLQAQLNSLQRSVDIHKNVFLGHFPSISASSCLQVSLVNPSSPSGYYWVRASNGSAVHVYCDMTRSCGGVTGGWMRVAYLQFENGSDPCPSHFTERIESGIRTCAMSSTAAAYPSILFDTYGISYSKVCGKVLAYQNSSTDAFGLYGVRRDLQNPTIDSNYVDGVSLTHGRFPRKHIWTFAAAIDEEPLNPSSLCPCSHPEVRTLQLTPPFVGEDYFCDSAVHNRFSVERDIIFHGDDPLWDGAGCGPNSTCCHFNSPPWFYKQLPVPTTDEMEMRVCRDQGLHNEGIPIAHVEIYVTD